MDLVLHQQPIERKKPVGWVLIQAEVQHRDRELGLHAAVLDLDDEVRAQHLEVGPQFGDGRGGDVDCVIFLGVLVGVKALVVDEDEALVPPLAVLGALVDDALVEDAVAGESVPVLVVGLLELAALLGQAGVDQLGEPDVVLRQVVELPPQLHSEVVHLLLMRYLDPERLLLHHLRVDLHFSHPYQAYLEFGELDVVRAADVGTVGAVVFDVAVEQDLALVDVWDLAVQLNELGLAV